MTRRECELLDRSLPVYNSPLPFHLWANIASTHLLRPVGLAEFRVWWNDYNCRYPKMLADAIEYLERQG